MSDGAPSLVPVGETRKLPLFQYWDSPTPPPEVAGWMAHVGANNPEFRHEVFDEARARAFIGERFGARERAAFDACAVPAMQADYLRLCALEACGGVYVDADTQSVEPLVGLVQQAPDALLFTFFGLLNNGVMYFARAHDPFVRACLSLATDNIEERRFESVMSTTGPGVLCAVETVLDPARVDATLAFWGPGHGHIHRALGVDQALLDACEMPRLLRCARDTIEVTPELESSFRRITRLDALTSLAPWLCMVEPAYKKTPRHWLRWPGSIYRS